MPKVTYERIGICQATQPNSRLLDISLDNEIPHYHACGGTAQCSTCRILVTSGLFNLTPRTEEEEQLAQRKGLPDNV